MELSQANEVDQNGANLGIIAGYLTDVADYFVDNTNITINSTVSCSSLF